jgi:hypothetical protein
LAAATTQSSGGNEGTCGMANSRRGPD